MTGKRFTIIDCGILGKCLRDNQSDINTDDLVIMSEWLNELHEKNNELRLQLNQCSDQRNEFHRGARENANRVGKLEKENEELKKDILRLMYTAEHLVNIKKLEDKWDIDYNQFISDLTNGEEHL